MLTNKHLDRYQVSLKALIINEHEELLVLNAVSTGTFAGYFDLPGGRIAVSEFTVPLLDVLHREITEELGSNIDLVIQESPVAVGRHLISVESELGENEPIHVMYLFFEAAYRGGNITISNEHSGFRWLNLKTHQLSDVFKSGLLEGVAMYLRARS